MSETITGANLSFEKEIFEPANKLRVNIENSWVQECRAWTNIEAINDLYED